MRGTRKNRATTNARIPVYTLGNAHHAFNPSRRGYAYCFAHVTFRVYSQLLMKSNEAKSPMQTTDRRACTTAAYRSGQHAWGTGEERHDQHTKARVSASLWASRRYYKIRTVPMHVGTCIVRLVTPRREVTGVVERVRRARNVASGGMLLGHDARSSHPIRDRREVRCGVLAVV